MVGWGLLRVALSHPSLITAKKLTARTQDRRGARTASEAGDLLSALRVRRSRCYGPRMIRRWIVLLVVIVAILAIGVIAYGRTHGPKSLDDRVTEACGPDAQEYTEMADGSICCGLCGGDIAPGA
jgi:hypothetical protein